MTKIFEYILEKPAEFFSFLGISSTIFYTIIRILKGFFGLFTRRRKRRREQVKMNKQAELVIEKLGGVEQFSEIVAGKVMTKQKSITDELMRELEVLATMDKCPIELRAYIETVLKANPTLLLQYEERKTKLIERVPKVTGIKIEEIKQELPTEEPSIQKAQKEDITYV